MNERKTASMLQRIPVILAVTAASYGLQLPPQTARPAGAGPRLASVDAGKPMPAAQPRAQRRAQA